MITAPRILIFDSGVGGLSITESIRAQHPHCSITYASDNAAFPYGTKDESELVERVDTVLHTLQELSKADILVVACNTASTVALPKIRERFQLPIIGVVPAIKPAAKVSESKVIGLLATPGTVSREYTKELINKFAKDCTVIPLGSSELVKLAEEKLRCSTNTVSPSFMQRLHTILEPLTHHPNMDTVVLACTHFPLLRNELTQILPSIKHWVDSGDAIARRVGYWLDELGLSNPESVKTASINTSTKKHYSLFTVDSETQKDTQAHQGSVQLEIAQLEPALSSRGLGDIRFVEIR
ncbi:MAG: glutamate racemase [Cellvibrionaceae bacterium]